MLARTLVVYQVLEGPPEKVERHRVVWTTDGRCIDKLLRGHMSRYGLGQEEEGLLSGCTRTRVSHILLIPFACLSEL